MGRPGARWALLAAVLALAGLAFALSPSGRAAVMAVLLLPHFFPGSVPRPLDAFTAAPRVETIDVHGAPGRMVADLYRPAGPGPHPAMVLLLGVNPLPRDDPQVVTLADGIARTGILTVVAESDALLRGEIRPEEVENLVALFQLLEQDPEVDRRRIGFSGFCIGGVLELLAAADPRIAPRVSYVNAFSVYAFAPDVLRAILAQQMPTPDGMVPWTPSALTRAVFLQHMIGFVPDERDRAALTRELVESTPLTSPEVQALSPRGLQMRALLTSTDPATIDMLLADLPPDVAASLALLSPGRVIGQVRAQTFLMHDEHDSYLPVSGARRLAELAGAANHASYTEFRLFEHVVPGRSDNPVQFAGELLKLFRHVHAVLLASQSGYVAP